MQRNDITPESLLESAGQDVVTTISYQLTYSDLAKLRCTSSTMNQLVENTPAGILARKTQIIGTNNYKKYLNECIYHLAINMNQTTNYAFIGIAINTIAHVLPGHLYGVSMAYLAGGALAYTVTSSMMNNKHDIPKWGLNFSAMMINSISNMLGFSAGFLGGMQCEQPARVAQSIILVDYVCQSLISHSFFSQHERKREIEEIRDFIKENPVDQGRFTELMRKFL